MKASDIKPAIEAAVSTASDLSLSVNDVRVLQNSNKLALRLLPSNVLARVACIGHEVAQFEVELARLLAAAQSPVAVLEPRVQPLVYERGGFAITFWTYHEQVTPIQTSPTDYAHSLKRLHAGMRSIDIAAPRYTDRITSAQELVENRDRTPGLAETDRQLLGNVLRRSFHAIDKCRPAEQLLHGEPHPGNVLSTKEGPLFIDLETCCTGPVEFDLAHVPEEVKRSYSGLDEKLLDECELLVLAMVAAWRWDREDQFPLGRHAGRALLCVLRGGPPWPSLDVVMSPASDK